MLRKILLITASVTIAVIVAVLVRLLVFEFIPRVLQMGDSDVRQTCSEVKPEMTPAEAGTVLHRHNRFGFEFFDGSREYIYWGKGGGCAVTIDEKSGRVLHARYLPRSQYDIRAMVP